MLKSAAARIFRHQSELSIAVASVFLLGGVFAAITAIIFPPSRMLTWPNPYIVAAIVVTMAVAILIRGRRLRRTAAGLATGMFVLLLLVTIARVDNQNRAIAAGLLIVCVIVIFAWFMPTSVARTFGYTALIAFVTVFLTSFPGRGTVLVALAITALSVLLTEVFGRFNRKLQQTSLTDHLCQVWNRAGFELRLQQEIRALRRTRAPLSLLFLDLDGFKEINDTKGHLAGDRVLQQMARSLEANIRGSDSVARIGGDEFVLILPHTTADEARELGLRLRTTVDACQWTFGVAEYREGENTQEFIDRSDAELIAHKRKRTVPRGESPQKQV